MLTLPPLPTSSRGITSAEPSDRSGQARRPRYIDIHEAIATNVTQYPKIIYHMVPHFEYELEDDADLSIAMSMPELAVQ